MTISKPKMLKLNEFTSLWRWDRDEPPSLQKIEKKRPSHTKLILETISLPRFINHNFFFATQSKWRPSFKSYSTNDGMKSSANRDLEPEVILGAYKSMRKQQDRAESEVQQAQKSKLTLQGSAKVVALALASNICVLTGKSIAAVYTGSSAMLAESIHSLADTMNECLLMWGISRSLRQPDTMHPYGFLKERYAWSLVSGVGIFFLGGGVSLYHGIVGLLNPQPLENLSIAFAVLSLSLLFDGATMIAAFKQIQESAKAAEVSVKDYIIRGADPTTVQILMEDIAAVSGVFLAGSCLSLSYLLKAPIFDSIGSIAIGLLLGGVASFLIKRNIASIVESSIPPARLNKIVKVMVTDPAVLSVHDVKATSMGHEMYRFKAEVNFNSKYIIETYISRNEALLAKEFKGAKLESEKDLSFILLRHGGGIINTLSEEKNRIESKIKVTDPHVEHIDLEIL